MPSKNSKLENALAAAERRARGGDDEEEELQQVNNNNNQQQEEDVRTPTQEQPEAVAAVLKQKKQISFEAGAIDQSALQHPSNFGAHPPVNEAWAFQPYASGGASSIGDDDVGGYSALDHSPSQDQSGSGGSDSDDVIAGSSLSGSSASSLSSNARRSKEIANRPMMLYMVSLIAVPILFLAIYQGMAVGTALSTLQYMYDHEMIVDHMLEFQRELEDQLVSASELIGRRNALQISGESSTIPAWAPQIIKDETTEVEESFTTGRAHLARLLMESAVGDGQVPAFHDHIIGLPEYYARAEMAVKRNNGPLFRKHFLHIMTELTTLVAALQQDDHSILFALDLSDMQLLMRITEQISHIFGMYREIEYTYNHSYDVISNMTHQEVLASKIIVCDEFANAAGKVDVLADYLVIGSGNTQILGNILEFVQIDWPKMLLEFEPFIKCDFRNRTFANDEEIDSLVLGDLEKLTSTSIRLFHSIADNQDVKNSALAEGMKLMGAVIACVIGVVILIFIQKNERKELLQIIDHADRLATAVRRFVPKNQLRMMGIRTVLQAEAGFSTEVAQGLVYNSMRNFGQISERMTRTELFDWLQLYVARMTYVVQQQRGYLDSILGDSSFSVFPQAVDAVGAGILMQQETDHMNIDLVAQKQIDLVRASCGIHYGVVVAGVFGDDNRLACTLVASDVNLCQRLQDLTKTYGNRIMLSRGIIDQIDTDSFEVRSLGRIDTLSDKNLEIFDLYQADPPVLKAFKNATREDFELAIRLALSDKPEDKNMANEIFDELVSESDELQVVDVAMMRKIDELKFGKHHLARSASASTAHTTIQAHAPQQSSSGASPAPGSASSRETTDVTGAAIDVTRVSLADAGGERYEELLRRSTLLREKRKNSMAKRSPSLQNLENLASGFQGSSFHMSNSYAGQAATALPSATTTAANNAAFTALMVSPPSNTNAGSGGAGHTLSVSGGGGAGAGAVSNPSSSPHRGSPASKNNNNNTSNNNNNPNNTSTNSNPQQQQDPNYLNTNSRQNSGNSPPQSMLRLGSDFAPRVQSFGYSSVGGDEKEKPYLSRWTNERKR